MCTGKKLVRDFYDEFVVAEVGADGGLGNHSHGRNSRNVLAGVNLVKNSFYMSDIFITRFPLILLTIHPYIHPSIHPFPWPNIQIRVVGELEDVPDTTGWWGGYSLDIHELISMFLDCWKEPTQAHGKHRNFSPNRCSFYSAFDLIDVSWWRKK